MTEAKPGNRVDELADNLQLEGRDHDLERELLKLDQDSLSRVEQESWWHLFGIVAFRDGREADALERFREAYEKFPKSAPIRFSLGQQYIRARDPEKGFTLFRTVKFPDVPREYALAQARYAYLGSRYEDGLLFLRPFFEAYKQVKILDDHFLYVRGLPFFGSWWASWAALSILSDNLDELESITQFVIENCHDYDFAYLRKELEAYRLDRPEILLEDLQERLGGMLEGDFSTGYTRMMIAAIRARAASTFEEAKHLITGVKLSEQDFPWLEDIRTLAFAEAAHRFDQISLEEQFRKRFLIRQPMLFEPDIALNFSLLRYQENLKPKVRFQ